MHHLVFTAITVIWGSSFILMKKAALAYGPVTIGGMRLVCGLAALLLMLGLRRSAWRPRGRDWPWLLAVVVAGYAWPYCLQPLLVHRHGSGFIGMMVGFVPLLTVGVQLPLLATRASLREVLGVLGGLICLYLVLQDGHQRAIPLGDLALAVTVPTGYALSNTMIRRRFAEVPTLPLTCWALGLAAVLVWPVGLVVDPVPGGEDLALATAALVTLGVVGTGLAIAMLYFLIQRRGPLFAGMVAYVIPCFAILWGWVDGEAVTPLQLAAMAGVLAMVALVQRRPRPTEVPVPAAGDRT